MSASAVAPVDRVGPEYRPTTQKPTATVSTEITSDNVHILRQTPQLIALLTYASFLIVLSKATMVSETVVS